MSEYRVYAGQYFPFLNWIRKYTFFLSGFSSQTLTIHRIAREERGSSFYFHSTTSTHSRTLRHLFATLYVRWLSRIFNHNACVYQTHTRWVLPLYWITIWLIDDVMFVCLLVELILGFCYSKVTWETSGFELSNSHRLSPLYYKRTYQPSVLVTPKNQASIVLTRRTGREKWR